MPDASPTKWHRAHTTWFFEQFLLAPHLAGYRAFDERFAYLFNSYYVAAGPRHARPQRGMVTQPDCAAGAALPRARRCRGRAIAGERDADPSGAVLRIFEIGLHHEQQHQELLLTDILHAFAQNPVAPCYDATGVRRRAPPPAPHATVRPAYTASVLPAAAIASTMKDRRIRCSSAGAHRAPARPQRAMARIHRRRRLRDALALAVRRLGRGGRARLECARAIGARSTAGGLR